MRSWPILVLILVGAVCGNSPAAIWYVDIDNTGTEDGTHPASIRGDWEAVEGAVCEIQWSPTPP